MGMFNLKDADPSGKFFESSLTVVESGAWLVCLLFWFVCLLFICLRFLFACFFIGLGFYLFVFF